MRIIFFFFIIISSITLLLSLVVNTDFIDNAIKKKKINQILLIDNNYMSKDFFLSKISTKEGQSYWLFNFFKLKKELQSLNELEEYEFNLDWAGNLVISVREKEPFMRWHINNHVHFIDDRGKILNYNKKLNNLKIINLYGENANIHVTYLKNSFFDKKPSKIKVDDVHFLKNIGWKIIFSDEKCVFFPLKELEKLSVIFENIVNSSLYLEFNFFDLRISERVYLSKKKC